MLIKTRLSRYLSNLPGWKCKQKIVVIESDDWGSIRMPSKKTFEMLKNCGVDIITGDNLRFNSYDTLASESDLSALFEVLSSIKDKNGNPAVITPISVMANPDFSKIKSSSFTEYHYEPFTDTLSRIPECKNSFALWQEGIKKHIFVPEFHGREHLNVSTWLRALQQGNQATLLAFDQGFWGFNNNQAGGVSYQAAFDTENEEEIEFHKSILFDGLQLFEKLIGYPATYFVPPNGILSKKLISVLARKGIKFVFANKFQREKVITHIGRYKFHYLGQKDRSGIRYITRNCVFEPSEKSKDWVDSCLSDIAIAFRWHKPAIISTHRVNYIGSLDPSNRSHGLKQLKLLLQQVTRKWSDLEFMTSAELGALMDKS